VHMSVRVVCCMCVWCVYVYAFECEHGRMGGGVWVRKGTGWKEGEELQSNI